MKKLLLLEPFRYRVMRWLLAVGLMLSMMPILVADMNEPVPQQLINKARDEYGRKAMFRMERWHDLMKDLESEKDELDKLEEVNDFFNDEIRFVTDLQHWRVIDYWATPYESLGTNGGDCEDYVIAKFYSLLRLGVSPSKLRFNYVKALDYNQAHMVLTYYPTPGAIPLVLDNINTSIRPANERRDLKPVYSFNAMGMWLDKAKGQAVNIGSANQLDRWTDLRVRMARIGLDI
ncbi:transglutaminase-like cysteine peptidase [Oceanobacter mangrovi]|uniref:transglutaminase-like cysteine peptidase n=1 Tax=Oceanobacter mangrovi TaxID=2862510 RepID=UPI001C8D6309|nr:transglutaminase-like cysteine peptidase [Oceanobacter mangrovi]